MVVRTSEIQNPAYTVSRQRILPARCHPESRWHARGYCSTCYRDIRVSERGAEHERKVRGVKVCGKCGIEKPLEDFYKNGARTKSHCKTCHRQAVRIYTHGRLDRDPECAAIRARSTRRSQDRFGRRNRLMRQYGLSLDDYDALLDAQGGVCAICLEPPDGSPLHVDHDHACCPGPDSCGKCVRGLLHGRCNRGLQVFHDDSLLLQRAAHYLLRTQNET